MKQPIEAPTRTGGLPIPAMNFLETVRANIDNHLLSDAEFRDFIRVTLPIVERPATKEERFASSMSD